MNINSWMRAALVGVATLAISASAAIAQSEMTDKIRLENNGAATNKYDFSVVGGNLGITRNDGTTPPGNVINGSVGIGTNAPTSTLEVNGNGNTQILANDTNATAAERVLFRLSNKGKVRFALENRNTGQNWTFDNSANGFEISAVGGTPGPEFALTTGGSLTLTGTLTQGSDVNRKESFAPVAVDDILKRVAGLEIQQWSYKGDNGVRHIGPMAQDFHAAFQVGATATGIATVDSDGVALASIQALYQLVQAQQKEIAALREQVETLKK